MESLALQSLRFTHFRNFTDISLNSLSSRVIFIGPNAVGKSNLVEGIQLLASQQSFRSSKTGDLIHFDFPNARLAGNFTSSTRDIDLLLEIKEGSKTLKVNTKKKTFKDRRSFLPVVVFCPDDLLLIKGSESLRRRYIDSVGSQISSSYKQIQHDFEKILKQKNQLLKQDFKASYLESINEVFNLIAAQYILKRKQLIERLLPYIQNTYASISNLNERLNLEYQITNPDKSFDILTRDVSFEEIQSYLFTCASQYQEQECLYKRCLYGPQLDKFSFSLNTLPSNIYASQGQQRSIVLACKIAELYLISTIRKEKPLLILDDVMSELDEARRSRFLAYLNTDIQSFITTTHLDYFAPDVIGGSQLINVQELVSRETKEL